MSTIPEISLVIPVFNEEVIIPTLYERTMTSLSKITENFEVIAENKAIKEMIPWLEESNIDDNYILNANSMLNFFWDKTEYDFPNGYAKINEENIQTAPTGTYIFWESHYTKRTSGLNYQYFQEKPDQFQLIRQVVSKDKRFVMLIYQKKA